jgi:O-acetyl-ADP-ribose deacetylase (regulator of RNase III)
MSIIEIKGNIFTTKAQTIVNTVNCVGVMGAGIALEFRLREPEMCRRYVEICKAGKLSPGTLWLYKSSQPQVLNFPTKKDWKHPSRPEYLEKGLKKFAATYREKGITSIAFPMLGADKGGLPIDVSKKIMLQYLSPLEDLDIEIYEYDPRAEDDLYEMVREFVISQDVVYLAKATGITRSRLETISKAMTEGSVCQISQLGALPGIGPGTLEKLFALRNVQTPVQPQKSLFDN